MRAKLEKYKYDRAIEQHELNRQLDKRRKHPSLRINANKYNQLNPIKEVAEEVGTVSRIHEHPDIDDEYSWDSDFD